ncbi:phosphoribosylanthranilate isomerase [Mongoliitalea daihaiensis]|uniref:phosphoribosylanthranilate isomerase n=1 Tax=Mongoliitalea daihaiensis TaxID=2782006 RepID=UPI001F3FB38A|nr:phosphoribosylanthranilate isomerase [Mongoliitalea daihaiensis]UJP64306.1 phosphoribosylanthranilate isomerase [Mongoliitalea daihaiensis]
MALKTFVKISNVNNLTDARYCAGMYVNWMGFCLEETNENYLSPEKYKEITAWLSGVSFVAEFEHSHPENILKAIQSYEGIDAIEISEDIHIPMLLNTGKALIYKTLINSPEDISSLISKAEGYRENQVTLLLESSQELLDEKMIPLLATLSQQTQVLLGFGLEASTLETILEQTGVYGVALKGGTEISPGLKDFDELAEILEILEVED